MLLCLQGMGLVPNAVLAQEGGGPSKSSPPPVRTVAEEARRTFIFCQDMRTMLVQVRQKFPDLRQKVVAAEAAWDAAFARTEKRLVIQLRELFPDSWEKILDEEEARVEKALRTGTTYTHEEAEGFVDDFQVGVIEVMLPMIEKIINSTPLPATAPAAQSRPQAQTKPVPAAESTVPRKISPAAMRDATVEEPTPPATAIGNTAAGQAADTDAGTGGGIIGSVEALTGPFPPAPSLHTLEKDLKRTVESLELERTFLKAIGKQRPELRARTEELQEASRITHTRMEEAVTARLRRLLSTTEWERWQGGMRETLQMIATHPFSNEEVKNILESVNQSVAGNLPSPMGPMLCASLPALLEAPEQEFMRGLVESWTYKGTTGSGKGLNLTFKHPRSWRMLGPHDTAAPPPAESVLQRWRSGGGHGTHTLEIRLLPQDQRPPYNDPRNPFSVELAAALAGPGAKVEHVSQGRICGRPAAWAAFDQVEKQREGMLVMLPHGTALLIMEFATSRPSNRELRWKYLDPWKRVISQILESISLDQQAALARPCLMQDLQQALNLGLVTEGNLTAIGQRHPHLSARAQSAQYAWERQFKPAQAEVRQRMQPLVGPDWNSHET